MIKPVAIAAGPAAPQTSPGSPPERARPLKDRAGFRLFALYATAELGAAVAQQLGCLLTRHEEREFEDGEHKLRSLEAVEGADVYVLQSLHGGPHHSADDKLCRLLFFIGALKDAGAARVTAVVPYLCYSRKDRRTKPFDPVTTRYVGALFDAVATDAVVTLDVHNPAAFENAFRARTVALTAAPLLVEQVASLGLADPLCVVSPDPGGVKRAEQFRESLEGRLGRPVEKAFVDKHRSAGVVTGDIIVGKVHGSTALIVDDLISTGGTLLRAAKAARQAGARRVIALATHGLFMSGAAELLADPVIDRLIVTDAVPPFRLANAALLHKIDTVTVAPLLADTIGRLHEHRSLTPLLVF
jgi:ribose-phosphate pyrophosphokinase